MKHLLLDKILPGQEALKSNKVRKNPDFREQGWAMNNVIGL